MRSTMEKVRYATPIDEYLYREFNKDKTLNSFFKPSRVGKCMQLIDEYYLAVDGEVTQSGWEHYYLERANNKNLSEASNFVKEKYKIDLDTATEYVFYRVIGQTWNGMMNELECIRELSDYFKNLDFVKAPYELDEEYCTDWQGFSNGKLLFGIQIKPLSYKMMSSPYQMQAKEYHKKQVEKYKERFGVAHFFIYHANNQMVLDGTVDKINTYLAMNVKVHLE